MKKIFMLALCLTLAGLLAVNGTFAGDFSLSKSLGDIFKTIEALGNNGSPTAGGATVNVKLVTNGSAQQLYPGGTASRTTAVQNQGSADVYFRLAYAVQYDAETWNDLRIDFSDEANGSLEEWPENDWQEIDVNGTPYRMKVFTYTDTLHTQSEAPGIKMTIQMSTSITSEQLKWYNKDFVKIQALAIEAGAFNKDKYPTPKDALDAALPLSNLNPF